VRQEVHLLCLLLLAKLKQNSVETTKPNKRNEGRTHIGSQKTRQSNMRLPLTQRSGVISTPDRGASMLEQTVHISKLPNRYCTGK
jgi:hypothetical protein